MDECIFCKIYKEKIGIIYENKYFYAQFDKFPVSPGHAEIIPKRHTASLLELTAEEWKNLQPALEDVINIIEKTDFKDLYQKFLQNPVNEISESFCSKMLEHIGLGKKPDGYNIGVNEGEAAGRTIEHLHIHIIPRYFGDVEDYAGGIRRIIPCMGEYRKYKK